MKARSRSPKLFFVFVWVAITLSHARSEVTFMQYSPSGAQPAAGGIAPHFAQVKMSAEKVAKTAYEKLGFSAGVGAIYMFDDEFVASAMPDAGGTLRVEKESRSRITGVLQAYYPVFGGGTERSIAQDIAGKTIVAGQPYTTLPRLTTGLQVLLEVGSDDLLRSFGLGLLWSWRRYQIESPTSIKVDAPAFNLGLAVVMEAKAKKLADGLIANSKIPEGDVVRYEQSPRFGLALTFSAGF